MRTIGVITVARSDYGIYQPVLERLRSEAGVNIALFVGGAHLLPRFGSTVDRIEEDGWFIAERIAMLGSDDPEGIARSIGHGTAGFAEAFGRSRPDLLLVQGDRFEMLSAVSAALPFAIPIAHMHGGELTQGAIDEQIRHAITKMSHLHFVSTPEAGTRVVQMGEEPWRVTVSGAPSLDNLRTTPLMPAHELEKHLGLAIGGGFLLVTYHPATLHPERVQADIVELVAALEAVDHPIVITAPNADTESSRVRLILESLAQRRPNTVFVENLGTQMYFSAMALASAMIGNSSSGIIEAASFSLPVVNIGSRQAGRFRAANVIDVPDDRAAIIDGIRRAVSPAFASELGQLENPYGDGHAAERIVRVLSSVTLDDRLMMKRFCTVAASQPGAAHSNSVVAECS